MRYDVRVAGRAHTVDADAAGRFTVDGQALGAQTQETVAGTQWIVRIGAASHEVTVLTRDPLRIAVDGLELDAWAEDERMLAARRGGARHASGRHELRAPMPGLVRAVSVREGDLVERDVPLVTLEAMKMENELRAPARGRVVKIAAAAGQKVEGGAVLVVLADAE